MKGAGLAFLALVCVIACQSVTAGAQVVLRHYARFERLSRIEVFAAEPSTARLPHVKQVVTAPRLRIGRSCAAASSWLPWPATPQAHQTSARRTCASCRRCARPSTARLHPRARLTLLPPCCLSSVSTCTSRLLVQADASRAGACRAPRRRLCLTTSTARAWLRCRPRGCLCLQSFLQVCGGSCH